MKRTTIFIDEKAERELDFLAQRRGEPKAFLVREAISEYLVRQQGEPGAPLAFVAIGRSGQSDISERHEELLFQRVPGASAPVGIETGQVAPARRTKRRRTGPR